MTKEFYDYSMKSKSKSIMVTNNNARKFQTRHWITVVHPNLTYPGCASIMVLSCLKYFLSCLRYFLNRCCSCFQQLQRPHNLYMDIQFWCHYGLEVKLFISFTSNKLMVLVPPSIEDLKSSSCCIFLCCLFQLYTFNFLP